MDAASHLKPKVGSAINGAAALTSTRRAGGGRGARRGLTCARSSLTHHHKLRARHERLPHAVHKRGVALELACAVYVGREHTRGSKKER
jgi:hypothetical protein